MPSRFGSRPPNAGCWAEKTADWAAGHGWKTTCIFTGTGRAQNAGHPLSDGYIGKMRGGCIEGALPTPGESGSARSRENSHKMAAKNVASAT